MGDDANRESGVPSEAIETIISPHIRELGDGFSVQRVLPAIARRMVGPFVFLDQMGPTVLRAGRGLDVRPHPHIGLATVTYLFQGEIVHRDSLGSVQTIEPGAVNWMTAGRGIAHSERTDPETRKADSPLFGIQSWVALPKRDEETEPRFAHHPRASLPVIDGEGANLRLIAGSLFGARAPVETFSPLFYADVELAAGARLSVPTEHAERAAFPVTGTVEAEGLPIATGRLAVFKPGAEIVLHARAPARLLLLGGAPLDGPRHMWWNFVASSKERIAQAKADWTGGRFAPVPGEHEFIPLPD